MKLPDGYILVPRIVYKDMQVSVDFEVFELIRCKNCKYCVQATSLGVPFLRCEQNKDAMKEVFDNDRCCWAEKREDIKNDR